MFLNVRDWLSAVLPDYMVTFGQYIDTDQTASRYIASIHGTGGPPTSVDTRRKRYHVRLYGRKNQRGDSLKILEDVEKISTAAIDHIELPCGAANVQVITEPVGPGYTEENRPFFTIDFEVTY